MTEEQKRKLVNKAEYYVASRRPFRMFTANDVNNIAIGFAEMCIDETTKELREENKQLREQVENLQIMLQAEREVRCNDEYLKKVTELEDKNEKLQEENLKLESKIKHLTEHLEPQTMTALFEQVEEEVKQEQRIKQLEKQIKKIKRCANCNTWLRNDDFKYCKNCPNLEGVKILRGIAE